MRPECKPVKQKLKRMKLERNIKIKKEVIKKFKANFVKVLGYLK